jgi:uncharacterized protein
MKNAIIKLFAGLFISSIVILTLLFVFQEKLIFFPQKLDENYLFNFNQKFEEVKILTDDGVSLHGILFKANNSKGLVFYLHGNAGSLSSWGDVAKTYTDFDYDVFILDYRGYGKSEGTINSEVQLISDAQLVYDELKKMYDEDDIIILGYSLGTGMASQLASANNPKRLILQAPFYSMVDLVNSIYPFIPAFILKYKFKTNEHLKNCNMPITIFHGDRDEVIYYGSSEKLKNEFDKKITLIKLHEQGHNGMTDNQEYIVEIEKVLM